MDWERFRFRFHFRSRLRFYRPLAWLLVAPALAVANEQTALQKEVQPFFEQYCTDCHSGDDAEANLQLDSLAQSGQVQQRRKQWTKIAAALRAGSMPPPEEPQPERQVVRTMQQRITQALANVDCSGPIDPGHVTIRRLNRIEYRNTVRDLLGIDYRGADDFPADDMGYGFDNIGDVLSLPPVLMEKYLQAAESIANQAVVTTPAGPATHRVPAADLTTAGGPARLAQNGALVLFSNGTVYTQFAFPRDGEYLLRVRAYEDHAGDKPARMSINVDRRQLKLIDIEATADSPGTYEHRARVSAGGRRVGLSFLNDYYRPESRDPKDRDRNLGILHLEIVGPLDVQQQELPESHRRIFIARPDRTMSRQQAAEKILRPLAARTYRRPVTDEELARLKRLVEGAHTRGASFEESVQLGLEALLVSPHFVFKVELDPQPNEPQVVRTLNDYELACRLSYFLWSSMPDDQLTDQARRGTLHTDENLERQVRRMLADPRAEALVQNFAGQWLELRNLARVTPDQERFPTWDEPLAEAMRTETEMLFRTIMRDNLNIVEFLEADYTFVNELLARHYGLSNIKGPEFRRVSLQGTPRRGVLGHASFLTVTSNPTRTSPVKRGKWILDNLLLDPPPPPAPDVPALAEGKEVELTGTLRQRFEQHRADPRCAACHERMDPLGFALENFDAIGAWRTKEGKFPIDASGTLPDGSSFEGLDGLVHTLVQQRRHDFARCLTEKMLTYALGRGIEWYDFCTVKRIVAELEKDQHHFSTLIVQIVLSDPFRKRRGKG